MEATDSMSLVDKLESKGVKAYSFYRRHRYPRNAKMEAMQLRWDVDIFIADAEILSTTWTMGCGHCPSHKLGRLRTQESCDNVRLECETGRHALTGLPIDFPELDFWRSFVSDCDSVDDTFQEWAANYGYDADSINARGIYDTLTRHRHALLQEFGYSGLDSLFRAVADEEEA